MAHILIQFYRGADLGIPTLADGEPAWATDTHILYVGQGGVNYPINISSSGTVTSVGVSGGTTGLTFSGGPITTSGTITMSGSLADANIASASTWNATTATVATLGTLAFLSSVDLTADVTGLLPDANGGTGVDSSAATGIAHVAAGAWTFSAVDLASSDVTGLLANTAGGTGADSSAASGIAHVAAGTWTFSAVDLASADVTGNLATGNGGTGADSSAATGIAHVSSGTWTFSAVDLAADVTGLLPPANGGTGADSSGATGIAHVAAGTWSYSLIDLTADVTGILPRANGGTGADLSAATAGVVIMAVGGTPLSVAATLATALGGLGLDASGWAAGSVPEADGAGAFVEKKNNWAGGGAPTATDDSGAGYSVGSQWVNGATIYECTDASSGAAVWQQMYPAVTSPILPHAAPADGDLGNSDAELWWDDTADNPRVNVKGKDSAGTVFNYLEDRRLEIPFAWGDATPETIGFAPADVIEEVEIIILVPFDGAGAALSVGDAGDTSRLMAATDNDPTTAGTYSSHPGYKYSSPTNLTISITPGAGASQGSGIVVIHF